MFPSFNSQPPKRDNRGQELSLQKKNFFFPFLTFGCQKILFFVFIIFSMN